MKKLLLGIFLFSFVNLSPVYGAQVATVISAKAILYADMNLTSAIGFVRNGKKLLVGENSRRRGSVLPVVVHGKVAWVEVKNISLKNKRYDTQKAGPRITEHNSSLAIEEEDEDPLNENNYLQFQFNTFSPSDESLNAITSAGNTGADSGSFGFLYEHRNPYKKMSWGVGFDYSKTTSLDVEYSVLSLQGIITWIPIRLWWISVEAFAGPLLSADFRVKVRNIGEYRGLMYGLNTGVQGRLWPDKKFGLVGGFGYRKNIVSGIKEVENDNNDDSVDVNSFNGITAFVGLTYRL